MLEEKDLEQIKALIMAALQPVKPAKMPKPKKSRKKQSQTVVASNPTPVQTQQAPTRIKKIVGSRNQIQTNHPQNRKKVCRVEPMDIPVNRPNLFLTSPDMNMFTKDIALDKKLSGNLTPTQRRGTVEMYEIVCKVCGRACIVSPSVVMEDPESGEITYTCDNCIRR